MLAWLLRLLILGAILGAGAFVAQRLLNRDEDWDDFDDFDESFEFQETPVEIEVPAQEVSQSASGGPGSDMSASTFADSEGGSADVGTAEGPGLTDVKGIGAAFEARLKSLGVNTLQDLAGANPESLNEQLDVRGGVPTIQGWISQAKKMSSDGSSSNGRSNQ